MTQKFQNKLFKKYPKIFRQKDLSCKETAMCWGIEFGDGWYQLIDWLCGFIQWYVDNNKIEQIEAIQIKEKFGGLRFYTNYCDKSINGAISLAEYMSYLICENCGITQNVSTNEHGYIQSLCKKCREKNKNKERETWKKYEKEE